MPAVTPAETAAALREAGLIAIVRGAFSRAQLVSVAEALLEGGVTALEVTLNTPDALAGVADLRRRLGDRALVGVGTVRTRAQVDGALDAGAAFLIAPGFDAGSVARAHERGHLLVPGVFTASEAQAAARAGCALVKLFPADALGPGYLRALRAPLDDLGFIPVGGIDVSGIAAYVAAGAVAFGVGSALVSGPAQEPAELTKRARAFVGALKDARLSGQGRRSPGGAEGTGT